MSSHVIYQEALDAYANPYHEFEVTELKSHQSGHAYKVTSKLNGKSIFLQEMGPERYPYPVSIQHNYEAIWKWLQTEEIAFYLPAPKYFPDDNILYLDSKEHYWRIFEYVNASKSLEKLENPSQARAIAQVFAGLTKTLEHFDAASLDLVDFTAPDPVRYNERFEQAIKKNQYERLAKSAMLIDKLKTKQRYISFYEVIMESGAFPLRLMHNQAGLHNVLFSETDDKVICPINLDRQMPAPYFTDLGELVRCLTVTRNDASIDLAAIHIQEEYYEAVIAGYM